MQFRLQSFLLAFVIVWCSLAAFGPWGILVALGLLVIAGCLRSLPFMSKVTRSWVIAALAALILAGGMIWSVVPKPECADGEDVWSMEASPFHLCDIRLATLAGAEALPRR